MDTWRMGMDLRVTGLVIFSATLLLAACGNPSDDTRVAASWEDGGGGVTVTVDWAGAAAGPVFQVTIDTHSVDLDQYDLVELAVLRLSDGRQIRPNGWDAPEGRHHRSGLLTFPSTTDGKPLFSPEVRSFDLMIRDIAGVAERHFSWMGNVDR